MLLVISPAKNLDFDSPMPPHKHSQCSLLNDAATLIDELKPLAPQEISKLMGISDKLGLLNYDRFQNWQRPFNKKNARPAAFAFAGDVYQGLDAYSFDEEDLAFAQDHLRILSGLYGLLKPLDLMQPYRLEMGTKFKNSRGENLYEFWNDIITNHLNKQIKKTNSKYLVNLASNEYFKSVSTKGINAEVVTPVFKDWKNGQYKIVSFFAKKARGYMSAYAIKNKIENVEHLKGFDIDSYAYNEAMSDGMQWVFTRKQ